MQSPLMLRLIGCTLLLMTTSLACSEDDADPNDPHACKNKDQVECEAAAEIDECLPWFAYPFSAEGCYLPLEYFGCSTELLCYDRLFVRYVGPDGTCVRTVRDRCAPSGWNKAEADECAGAIEEPCAE